jgi:hypothetical protein
MPRRNRTLDVSLAKGAHVRIDRAHQGDARSSLDGRHVRRLVMRATLANRDHRTLDKASNTFDYV